LTIGRTTGSTNRVSGPGERAGLAAIVGLREVSQAIRLVGHDQRVDQRVQLPLENARTL